MDYLPVIAWSFDADNACDLDHLCWINWLDYGYFDRA